MEKELYEIVCWPEVQPLMERHGFESNSFLVNDETDRFGCDAYFVRSSWLRQLVTDDKARTIYAFLSQMPDMIRDIGCGEFGVGKFGIRFNSSYGGEQLLDEVHFSDCHSGFLCNEDCMSGGAAEKEYARVVDVLLGKVATEYASRFLTKE